MKERPIIFSGPMVQAILDGSKTQTRRAVKLPSRHHFADKPDYLGQILVDGRGDFHGSGFPVDELRCPYGMPGDRLWVKETTVNVEDFGYLGPVWLESEHGRNVLEYGLAPSEDDCTEVEPEDLGLRPSIFMPRAMSRITLEITGVRVERLHDITRGDCMAEGCPFPNIANETDPFKWYRDLWGTINGPDSWAANPWVWVIEFRRVKGGAA
jgi:hypothetical protein